MHPRALAPCWGPPVWAPPALEPGGALDPGRPEEESVRRGRTGGAVSKVPVDIDVDIGIGIDLDLGLDIKIRIKITISSKRLLLLLTRPSTLG